MHGYQEHGIVFQLIGKVNKYSGLITSQMSTVAYIFHSKILVYKLFLWRNWRSEKYIFLTGKKDMAKSVGMRMQILTLKVMTHGAL